MTNDEFMDTVQKMTAKLMQQKADTLVKQMKLTPAEHEWLQQMLPTMYQPISKAIKKFHQQEKKGVPLRPVVIATLFATTTAAITPLTELMEKVRDIHAQRKQPPPKGRRKPRS